MLNRFTTNNRQIQNIVTKINNSHLVNIDITGSINNIVIPSNTKFQSRTRTQSYTTKIPISVSDILNVNITGSINNISASFTQPTKFESKTKSNPNPIKIVNNTNNINDFHTQIFEYSARYESAGISEIKTTQIGNNLRLDKLIIYNKLLDYGTEEPTVDNFDLLHNGLHISGIFDITQNENNIEITFNTEYLCDINTTYSEFILMGKMTDIYLNTESYIDLKTENALLKE
jgi:hypothetical protein